jgi:hypothetical protein
MKIKMERNKGVEMECNQCRAVRKECHKYKSEENKAKQENYNKNMLESTKFEDLTLRK